MILSLTLYVQQDDQINTVRLQKHKNYFTYKDGPRLQLHQSQQRGDQRGLNIINNKTSGQF